MAMKYYAAQEAPLVLTLSTTQQTTMYSIIVWNIMRMLLMDEEDVDAESALEMLDEMEMQEFNKLKERAASQFADWDFQAYMERKGINPESKEALIPVEELLKDPDETDKPTPEQTNNLLMEMLNEYGWSEFQTWEIDNSSEMD